MKERWDAFMSRAGFFTTIAICLLVAGVSAYFLLAERDSTPSAEPLTGTESPVTETGGTGEEPREVSAAQTIPLPETEEEEEPEVTQTVAPVPEKTVMPEADTKPVAAEAPQLIVAPLRGEVLAAFSADALVYNAVLADWRTHEGVDIAAKPGATVQAACAGTVESVEDHPLMGTTVTIGHADGYRTTYANLQAVPTVKEGERVTAGQIIGAVGTTAVVEGTTPHLHFAVTCNGEAVDPNEFLEG